MGIINQSALYTDESSQYRIPAEVNPGDTVTVLFRTAKDNADQVFLISGRDCICMEKTGTNERFDYYSLKLQVGNEVIRYFFEIRAGEERLFYNMRGISNDLQEMNSLRIIPGFSTPDWAKGAVMYQIYVDRFCNGDPSNDVVTGEYCYIGQQVEGVTDWNRPLKSMDVRSFYGGDLQGILDKLDYLVDLGIEVIYMNPIFVSPSNHKYDCQDYDYIDPHYTVIQEDGGEILPEGEMDNRKASKYRKRVVDKKNLEASNEFFIHFVEEVHKRGIRIVLDGVFNHCGSFNKWLDRERIYEQDADYEKGAYVSADSPYRNFFKFNNMHDWPYNEYYDGWWGHDTLPKLNYEESQELYDYIMGIARKWVSPPYNVDGWRLDVAADLGFTPEFNHKFWKDFRKNVKEANPEAVIYAEHYGDPKAWLQGDEWDSVMNYDAFMEPVTWFLTGMEKHSDAYKPELLNNEYVLADILRNNMCRFPGASIRVAMNQLSNHDHSRFLTRTNHKVGRLDGLGAEAASEGVSKAVFREAVMMQMTWPGAPTLYYGDEAGLCGFTDPDNRRPYPWGQEDQGLIRFHKEMIRIHKENKVCSRGCFKVILYGHGIFSYGRFDAKDQLITVFNNNAEGQKLKIPVWEAEVPDGILMERLMLSIEHEFNMETANYLVLDGNIEIFMPPYSAAVLRNRKETEKNLVRMQERRGRGGRNSKNSRSSKMLNKNSSKPKNKPWWRRYD